MSRILPIALLSLLCLNSANADLYSASNALSRGDYETAVAEFTILAEKGDDKAQANLGYMYYAGEGVPQDYQQAVYWYRKAAVQGNRDAQYNLAVSYAFGEGVAQDLTEAAIWYRRAGEQGHVVSQYSLGISYAYGEGVPQDQTEAARWFTKAANQGYARAQVQLGSMHHTGEGVTQDYSEAVRWYRMAADRGDATAQYNLGTMYRSGKGVEQNYAQAKRWFRQSADQGYAAAQNELASLERSAGANVATRTIQVKPEIYPTESIEPIAQEELPESIAEDLPVQEEKLASNETSAPTSETKQISEGSSTDEPTKKPLFSVDKKDLLTLDSSQLDIPEPIVESVATATPVPDIKKEVAAEIETPLETEIAEVATTELASVDEAESKKPEVSAMHKAMGLPQPEPAQEKGETSENLFTAIGNLFSSDDGTKNEGIEESPEAIESTTSIAEDQPPTEVIASETAAEEYVAADDPTLLTNEPVDIEEVIAQETAAEEYVAAEDPTLLTNEPADIEEVIAQETAAEEYVAAEDPTLLTNEPADIEEVIAQETAAEEYVAAEDSTLLTNEPADIEEVVAQETAAEEYVAAEDPTLLTESTDAEQVEEETETSGGFFSAIGKFFSGEEKQAEPEIFQEETQKEEDRLIAKLDDPTPAIEEIELAQDVEDELSQYSVEAGRRALSYNDYEEAEKQFRPLAEAGDNEAQSHLGSLYYAGKGVEQSIDDAFSWYKKAADQGNVDAQYSIGNMFLLGESVEQNNEKAAKWYERASEQGHVAAASNLKNIQKLNALNRENKLEQHAVAEQVIDEDTSSEATTVKSYAAGDAPSTESLQTYSDTEPSEVVTRIDTNSEAETSVDVPTIKDEEAKQTVVADTSMEPESSEQSEFFESLFGKSEPESTALKEDDNINLNATESVEESVTEATVSQIENDTDESSLTVTEEAEVEKESEKAEGLFGFFGKMFSSDKEKEVIDETENKTTISEEITKTESVLEEPTVANSEISIVEQRIESINPKTELEKLRTLAIQGDPEAQYKLGTLYYSGDGVKQDFPESALWYRRAAQQGNADAQYSLGNLYLMGEGLEQDDQQAADWYALAAVQGHMSATHNLASLQKSMRSTERLEIETGTDDVATKTNTDTTEEDISSEPAIDMTGKSDYEEGLAYAFGDGVPQNDRNAFNLFYAAAKKGYALAQYKVGVAYAYGEGVRQDNKLAAEWYQKAAEQGYTIAQRNLATMYLDGNGIQQDKVYALAWYNVVASQGNAMDIRRRDMLEKELSENELAQSQELSNQISSRLNSNSSL